MVKVKIKQTSMVVATLGLAILFFMAALGSFGIIDLTPSMLGTLIIIAGAFVFVEAGMLAAFRGGDVINLLVAILGALVILGGALNIFGIQNAFLNFFTGTGLIVTAIAGVI